MGRARDLGDRLWSGEVKADQQSPFAPLFEAEELASGALFISSFANVTAIDTDDGLVLVDVGSALLAEQVQSHVRDWSKKRVHTAVFTHGHIDHVMGMARFDHEAEDAKLPRPRVIAHEAVPARFERYVLTAGYNACINTRQFQMPVIWPTEFRAPDETYRDRLSLDVGGTRIELHHARGETDDHTWAWLPDKKIVVTGDLFLWVCPNAGNPQKVQRYPREWARALREMEALGAEVLSPGHGVPIFGADRVKQALGETAELLEHLHDRTVALMNEGARLDTILAEVRAPERLLARPYLRPLYDEPEFIVRTVWRLYGGWYDGNPSHLKPARDADLAREVATLAGGAPKLAARATELAANGQLALACHLAEMAAMAAPSDAGIEASRAEVYRLRAKNETSLMARGIYNSAANERHVPHSERTNTL